MSTPSMWSKSVKGVTNVSKAQSMFFQHATQELSSNIKENTSVKYKETTLEVKEEGQAEEIYIHKFKCMRCKEIVYKKDALKEYDENGQNMCSLCTILS